MGLVLFTSTTLALGSRSSSSSSSSSSRSSSSSKSSSSFSFSKPSSSSSGGSSSSSKSSSYTINRASSLSSLSNKGATGEQAGALFKRFQQSKPTTSSYKTSADLSKSFDPIVKSQRRSSYYNGYTPSYGSRYQTVVVQHQNSGYGIWDLMLFNSIMDNVGDRAMYYHHQNDPAFQSWRSDANEACAAGDKDVCDKLKDLDREMAEYKAKGIQQNDKYITPGVDPDIYESNNIDIKSLNKIKVCTGGFGSDYNRFSSQLGKAIKIPVEMVSTNGSIDNLTKLGSGECDLGFVQSDLVSSTPNLINILKLNKQEVSALICGVNSGVQIVGDIKPTTKIYIGSDQTGSQFTMDEFRKINNKLNVANVDTSKTTTVVMKDITKSDCFFSVSDTDNQFIKMLDDKKEFKLIPIEDMGSYTKTKVNTNEHKNLTQDRYKTVFGYLFGTNGTVTVGTSTILVAPKSWVDQNKQAFDLLVLESNKLENYLQ